MTLEEFRERYDAHPIDDYSYAVALMEVMDAPDLAEAARTFADAHAAFFEVLDGYNLQIG